MMLKFWFITYTLATWSMVSTGCVDPPSPANYHSTLPQEVHKNSSATLSSSTTEGVDCSNLVFKMADCLPFLGTSPGNTPTPTPECCSDFKSIFDTAPQCICYAINAAPKMGISFNLTKAAALPSLCKVNAPPLSLLCNVSVPPQPSPEPSPAPPATPSSPPVSAPPSSSPVPSPPKSSPGPPTTPPPSPPATPTPPTDPSEPPSTSPAPPTPTPTQPPSKSSPSAPSVVPSPSVEAPAPSQSNSGSTSTASTSGTLVMHMSFLASFTVAVASFFVI